MNQTIRWMSVVLVTAAAATHAAVPPAALVLQDAIAGVASKAKPAVVNISVTQEQRVQVQQPDFFFGDPEDMLREFMQGPRPRERKFRAEGTGSGFIIDPKGFVLTNEHVIRGASEIRVTMTLPNGKDKTYPGKVVGRDPNFDMAVVKIQANEQLAYRFDMAHLVKGGNNEPAVRRTISAGREERQRVEAHLSAEGRPAGGGRGSRLRSLLPPAA